MTVNTVPKLDESEFPSLQAAVTAVTPREFPKHKEEVAVSHTAGIAIVAAMVDAEGDEIENEWCTIANFSKEDVDLNGWMLSDTERPALALSGKIPSGETLRVGHLYDKASRTGVKLANKRGTLELSDEDGTIVDRVSWTKREQKITEGVPVAFHQDESSLPTLRIIACLVNAPGDERVNEWVNIINLGAEPVHLEGWSLSDNTHHRPWPLEGDLLPGESKKFAAMYESESGPSVQLGNRRGTIVLLDPLHTEVDKVSYHSEKKFKVGIPLTFLLDKDVTSDGFGDQESADVESSVVSRQEHIV